VAIKKRDEDDQGDELVVVTQMMTENDDDRQDLLFSSEEKQYIHTRTHEGRKKYKKEGRLSFSCSSFSPSSLPFFLPSVPVLFYFN
jgi:hypothetical protein